VDDFEDALAFVPFERQSRGSHPFLAETRFLHRQLDVLDELGVHIEMEQGREPAIKNAGFLPFPLAREFPEILVLARKGDARAGHPAVNAENARFERQVINAGEDGVTIADRVVQIGDASNVAGTFLQRDEVFLGGQLGKKFRRQVVRVADRIVINHDRQAGVPGYRPEMRQRLVRIALVKHGGHDHDPVRAQLFHILDITNRFRRAGLRHSAEHRDPSVDRADHGGEKLPFLGARHGLVFSQRTQKDQAAHT
jgi:hypothetical protein